MRCLKIAAKKRSTKNKKFKNRFEKFYELNKERINKKRKKTYREKVKKGICVRCKRKALKDITFCSYHRKKQKEYNERR